MASNEEDLWYLEYDYYDKAINEFNRAIIYGGYDEGDLDKTILYMNSLVHNLKKSDYIIQHLFRLLSNSPAFYTSITPNYCKYINIWLNEKYRDEKYHSQVPNFDVLKKFVHKLTYEKYRNHKNSCEKYIKLLDNDIINNINFLHSLYDAYNKIKTPPPAKDLNDTCSKIVFLDRSYRDSIYKYYVNDKNLFDKLEKIKALILKKINNLGSDCVKNIYFNMSKELTELREKEALKAKEEEELRKQNEAEKTAREEQLRKGHAEMEQQREQPSRGRVEQLELPQSNTLQGTSLDVAHQTIDNSEGLQTSAVSGLPEHTHMSQSLERSRSSRGSLFLQEYTPEEQLRYKREENEPLREQGYEQKYTSRSTDTFLGSLGLPDSITGVLGQVDPIPVVGVSGGMGALFLLFRYTPVGTFFRGRGYRQRIPTRFEGVYPGFMTDFQGYGDGYFPNDRINITYGRE